MPVPLPDMIGALVQGWKSEGNWPPKSGGPTSSIIQEGGKRASELLKFRRCENGGEKGRVRKGVGAVKKALGLRRSTDETNVDGLVFEDDRSREGELLISTGWGENCATSTLNYSLHRGLRSTTLRSAWLSHT